jgi:hypothetical protein
LCDCTNYKFILESDDYILVTIKSNSSVSGRFTAWQEPPVERQILATNLALVGLAGIATLLIFVKKK